MPDPTFNRTLVTAALPYANGPIHIGHLAGAYLPADLYVRYLRSTGADVVFVCGSDEHGVPITLRAEKEGVSPKVIIDRYHTQIASAFRDFGMSFDIYSRTSSPTHRETAQEFFRTLYAKGVFVQKPSMQFYDEQIGMSLPDRYVEGTCPVCGNEQARGDQCERCGTYLEPTELINPRSKVSGAVPTLRETVHYYLPLGRFQPELEAWQAGKTDWKDNVLNYCRGWFKEGLQDRAITRDLNWGVPVPPEIPGSDGKVLYVWFDAPIGYLSATKEWAASTGEPEAWRRYWQQPDSQLVHFIGKDNIVFHAVVFPAMLMAEGSFILPDNVPANEFLNLEGEKLSTSRNWAIWLHEYLAEFPADPLRYTLAATLPETKDTDFSWREVQSRTADLADILGNFVKRAASFTERYFDNTVPERGDLSDLDRDLVAAIEAAPGAVAAHFEKFKLRDAVAEAINLARIGNRYFDASEPWRTRKTDPARCATTLNLSLNVCRSLAILLEPVLPHTMATVWTDVLRLPGTPTAAGWASAGTLGLAAGHLLGPCPVLFAKLDDAVVEAQIAKLKATAAPVSTTAKPKAAMSEMPAPAPAQPTAPVGKPEITIDDFGKVDLRVAEVLSAEPVAKSDKLLKLRVSLGDGQPERQIVAGLAKHIAPADLVGKRVVIVANLKPAKLRGELSEGMVLAAEGPDGTLVPLALPDLPAGSEVR